MGEGGGGGGLLTLRLLHCMCVATYFPVLQHVAPCCNLRLPMRLVHGGRREVVQVCVREEHPSDGKPPPVLRHVQIDGDVRCPAAHSAHTPLLNSERARGLRGARLSLGRLTRGGGLRERGLRLVRHSKQGRCRGLSGRGLSGRGLSGRGLSGRGPSGRGLSGTCGADRRGR